MHYTYTINTHEDCIVIIAGRLAKVVIMTARPHPSNTDVFHVTVQIHGGGLRDYWMTLVTEKEFETLAFYCRERTTIKKKYVLQRNILGFKKGVTSSTLDRDGRVLFKSSNGASISLKIGSKFITEDAGR